MMARLAPWWRARNRREKLLAVVAVAALAGSLLEFAWLAPQRAAQAQAQREIETAQAQLDRLRATAAELASRHAPATATDSLAERRRRAQARIDRAQAGLIAPQDMAQQLRAIVERHRDLRVVGLQSLPPAPVEGGALLYERGLRVDVEGRYLELLAWLEALEAAPHRIYWRSLQMKADTGVPVTRLELYTLSKEPVWLRL